MTRRLTEVGAVLAGTVVGAVLGDQAAAVVKYIRDDRDYRAEQAALHRTALSGLAHQLDRLAQRAHDAYMAGDHDATALVVAELLPALEELADEVD